MSPESEFSTYPEQIYTKSLAEPMQKWHYHLLCKTCSLNYEKKKQLVIYSLAYNFLLKHTHTFRRVELLTVTATRTVK